MLKITIKKRHSELTLHNENFGIYVKKKTSSWTCEVFTALFNV